MATYRGRPCCPLCTYFLNFCSRKNVLRSSKLVCCTNVAPVTESGIRRWSRWSRSTRSAICKDWCSCSRFFAKIRDYLTIKNLGYQKWSIHGLGTLPCQKLIFFLRARFQIYNLTSHVLPTPYALVHQHTVARIHLRSPHCVLRVKSNSPKGNRPCLQRLFNDRWQRKSWPLDHRGYAERWKPIEEIQAFNDSLLLSRLEGKWLP